MAHATIIEIATETVGNKLNFTSVEVTSHAGLGYPNRIVTYDQLLHPAVTDYQTVAENNAANTVTVLATPDAEPPSGVDRLALISDAALNTGIFNPSAALPGLTLTFDPPLVNGPGADLVIFELSVGTQTPDPVVVIQADGSGTPHLRRSSNYEKSGTIPSELTPTTWLATVDDGGRAGLNELVNNPLTPSAVTNAKWHAVPCDFDDLAVPLWGAVDSLALLSDDATRAVDLLMVAGLPSASVPGDYDRDGDNDDADFLEWRRMFGSLVQPGYRADGNGDGMIDAADYVVWRRYFGATVNTSAGQESHSVPEPCELALAVVAFMAAAFIRRVR
jgi:hypothetical protein